MTTVFIVLAWSLFFCAIVGVIVLIAQASKEQRRSRKKPVMTSIPLKQQAYIHPSQPNQGRKPAPYHYVPPRKQEKDLKQSAVQSQTNQLNQAKSWQAKDVHKQPKAAQQQTSASRRQAVDSKVQKHLFTLVNGDMKIANRLLDHVRQSNPLQSEQWVWEKVIYDLERDRT